MTVILWWIWRLDIDWSVSTNGFRNVYNYQIQDEIYLFVKVLVFNRYLFSVAHAATTVCGSTS